MKDPFHRHAAALVGRYRRQRPLRGGSLLVTIFGDSIAPRGGAVTLSSLIQLGAAFGLAERLVRTSVARLAQDDWLRSRREGRLSEYALSDLGRRRFAAATARIYAAAPVPWRGRWTLLVLAGDRLGDRRRVRERLGWSGFGEIAAGVFAHPSLDREGVDEIRQQIRDLRHALVFDVDGTEADVDRRVAGLGWDLESLGRRYGRFIDVFAPLYESVARRTPEPLAAFQVRTLLIHEYRRIHLRDPLLPATLLPDDWIGARAQAICRDLYLELFDSAESYVADTATRLAGRLPAPDASIQQRFGGLRR